MTTVLNSQAKLRPSASPIDILRNDSAKLYTHLHPVLVLSLYAYQFRSMVADPVLTLTRSLVPLSILQIAYVAICLPPTGSSGSSALQQERRKPGERKKPTPGKVEVGINVKIIPAFLSLLLSALVATPLLTATLILFGAPITTHHTHTLLCGAHIALLSTLPLVYVHGVDGETWRETVALLLPIDDVYGGLIGTIVGAWVGAVPIPLDWDREWQKWPITIVTGAYIGFVVGKSVGGTLLKGRKIMFE